MRLVRQSWRETCVILSTQILPDAESYTLFADLFNPVIEDYHGGFKPTDRHPPTNFGDINTIVDVDPENVI